MFGILYYFYGGVQGVFVLFCFALLETSQVTLTVHWYRQASRAGTRGFRAPEVLMRVQQQTTGNLATNYLVVVCY
jgi:hypothetical protein